MLTYWRCAGELFIYYIFSDMTYSIPILWVNILMCYKCKIEKCSLCE